MNNDSKELMGEMTDCLKDLIDTDNDLMKEVYLSKIGDFGGKLNRRETLLVAISFFETELEIYRNELEELEDE